MKKLSPMVMGVYIGAMLGCVGMMICGGIGRTDLADFVLIGGLGLGGGIGALLKWLDDRKNNNAINLEEDKDNG